MKNILYRFLFLLAISAYMASSYAYDNLEKSSLEAQEVLNKFLSNEYHGEVDQRIKYAAIHLAGKLLYGDSLSELTLPGITISICCYPLVPVIGYQIVEHRIQDQNYIVFQVMFNQIGQTQNKFFYFRKLLLTHASETRVEYDLIKTDQGWKILDPVIPRVSVKVLKTEFEQNWESCSNKMSDPVRKTQLTEFENNQCIHYENELDKINKYLRLKNNN